MPKMGTMHLSEQITTAGDSVTGGRDEIEITPEMENAGAEIVWSRFSDVLTKPTETARDVAIEVYRAMAAIRHRAHYPA